MKTAYYIVGPSASGKTTASKKLQAAMGLPLYHADMVYKFLHEEYKTTSPAPHLTHYEKWDDPRNFGIESWGAYNNIEEAKAPLFERLITDKTSDIIMEGFTLSFPSERKHVERVIGPHRAVILRLDLPFEKWADFFERKNGKPAHFRQAVFNRLRSCFSAQEGDVVYTFDDPNMVPVHWSAYQRPGFTDRKIEALKIPLQSGDIVNDIGCNAGEIGKWCLDHGASFVRGYERNWRFLDEAFQRGLEPHLGDVETERLQPADINLCASTFQYFKNPRGLIEKVHRATRRVFVLELPIYQAEGMVAKFYEKGRHTDYSTELIEFWLREHFPKVERVGESIPPNRSYRLVYHAYVQPDATRSMSKQDSPPFMKAAPSDVGGSQRQTQAAALGQAAPNPWRDIAIKAAASEGKNWRDIPKDERQKYLSKARKDWSRKVRQRRGQGS